MKAMKTIYLFRHAQTDWRSGTPCCLGSRTDAPITAEGRAAACALAPLLRERGIEAVRSSPMLRCRQTAQAMSGDLPVGTVPGLEELDCGDWDGLSFDEIRARYPEDYARRGLDPALPPPGGETPAHAAQRGLAALYDLAARTRGDLAVVAHAGLNRAVLCALLNKPFQEMRTLPQPYLCVNILRYDGGRFAVGAVGIPFPRRDVGISPYAERQCKEELP